MKLHIYQLAFIAFTAFTVSSCKDTDINDEHHYDNKLYTLIPQHYYKIFFLST